MKAMIMAAGLGTRLRPWTLEHPKALVPVGGVPMLERVICKLRDQGFDYIVVNAHHFAGQIVDFLAANDFGVEVVVSDESGLLLDTGGGIVNAIPLLERDDEPLLVHNVDILSDAPLAQLMAAQTESSRDILLLTSGRKSSRKLIFTPSNHLAGWHRLDSDQFRPDGFRPAPDMSEEAFSGIYVVSMDAARTMRRFAEATGRSVFPVMDFFMACTPGSEMRRQLPADSLLPCEGEEGIGRLYREELRLMDIGRPETLCEAEALFR